MKGGPGRTQVQEQVGTAACEIGAHRAQCESKQLGPDGVGEATVAPSVADEEVCSEAGQGRE